MPEMMYRSEYVEGARTAQVLQNMATKKYVVYCFCCGHEAESQPFDTESAAENWAEDWVQKAVELPALVEAAGHEGCGCNG